MKIALITIHKANNYGALLQAFALQQTLTKFGNVDLIDYENQYLSMSLDPVRLSFTLHGFLGIGKDLCRLLPRYRLIKKFRQFIAQHFMMTAPFTQDELYSNKLPGYDYYIVGSDQVWNAACVNREGILDPIYFLEFAPAGSNKISYASSIGGYVYSEQERLEVKEYLNSFSAVSVREKNTQQYLTKLGLEMVEHVLDPTLLLDKSQWETLFDTKTSSERYILLYTVPKVSLVRLAVDYFSKLLGIKVIAIDQGLTTGAHTNKHIQDAGPEDFLTLFAGAEFIITDSFHGVCFSINFERPFVALSPGVHANRVESLLALMGLSAQYASNESDFAAISVNVDFTEPRDRLALERKASLQFLQRALCPSN